MADLPNVLFFHADNLGFGELSCYSGGPFRGATTERVDAFAADGFRLTNYCPESQCTPTRSALLTGRHAIRSGTHSVPIGSPGSWGLVAWEKMLGDLLSDRGYACAAYGKWHVCPFMVVRRLTGVPVVTPFAGPWFGALCIESK